PPVSLVGYCGRFARTLSSDDVSHPLLGLLSVNVREKCSLLADWLQEFLSCDNLLRFSLPARFRFFRPCGFFFLLLPVSAARRATGSPVYKSCPCSSHCRRNSTRRSRSTLMLVYPMQRPLPSSLLPCFCRCRNGRCANAQARHCAGE